MSTVVEYAPHNFGRHTLLDGMARPPHHSYHEAYAPKHGYYAQEQQVAQPPQPQLQQQQHQQKQQQHLHQPHQQPPPPRLPSMAAMISSAAPSHLSAFSNGRDMFHSSSRQGYYSDYATPSPVGQTPPQFPGPNSSDMHPLARRPVDVRRSPTLSSTASDRSSDEVAQEMRLRQMNSIREHHNHGQMPTRPYHHLHQQSPPRSRGSSFHHDGGASHMPVAYMNGSHGGRSASPTGPQSPPSTQPSASPRQETKSMSISNLLSSDSHNSSSSSSSKKPMQSSMRPSTSSSEYKITVRQQPYAARSCGFGERDRRVIDPPPIVQLSIHDDSLSPDELGRRLRHQFSVVHCSIWDEEGNKDMSSMPEDFRQQRRLMGTLVASPFVGQDEDGQEGCFFCFPDLSCRTPGTFRLKFALVVLDPTKMHHGDRSAIVATAMSEPFQVYNAKDFPGMKASTPLTKRLKEQGCLISIKKGNEKAGGGSSHGRGGDDSAEEEDDEEGETKARSRKRQKRSGV